MARASAVFLAARPKMVREPRYRFQSNLTLAFSIATFYSYTVVNTIPFDPVQSSWDGHQALFIGDYYLLLSPLSNGLPLGAIFFRHAVSITTL